jgi:hypothetical protein
VHGRQQRFEREPLERHTSDSPHLLDADEETHVRSWRSKGRVQPGGPSGSSVDTPVERASAPDLDTSVDTVDTIDHEQASIEQPVVVTREQPRINRDEAVRARHSRQRKNGRALS